MGPLIIIAAVLAWLGFYFVRDWRDTLHYQIRVVGTLDGKPGVWSSTFQAKAQQMESFGPTSGSGRPHALIKGAATFIPVRDGYIAVLLRNRGTDVDIFQSDLLEISFNVLGRSPNWDTWRNDWHSLRNSDRSAILKPADYPIIIHTDGADSAGLFTPLDGAALERFGLKISQISIQIVDTSSKVSQSLPTDLGNLKYKGKPMVVPNDKFAVGVDALLKK